MENDESACVPSGHSCSKLLTSVTRAEPKHGLGGIGREVGDVEVYC